jgi:hypothetical protein
MEYPLDWLGVKDRDFLGIGCICKDCNNKSKSCETDEVLKPG